MSEPAPPPANSITSLPNLLSLSRLPLGGLFWVTLGPTPTHAMLALGVMALVYRAVPTLRHWLRYDFRASPLGKAATITQFLAIGALVMGWPAAPLAWGAFALGIIALGDYVRRAVEIGRQRLHETEQGKRP